MKNKLVSIIIPLYNNEKFIGKCLYSAINQLYENIEIIVVNDGSTDKSESIVKKYMKDDDRIKLISKENTGVSDTRNIGLDNAHGEYICFSDADDILSKDYVSYMVSLIENTEGDIASCNDMFGNFNTKQNSKIFTRVVTGKEAAISILCYKVPIGVYSKIFKSVFLKKNDIRFRTDLVIGEGFNFNMDAFQHANKVIMSNKKIYYYRRNNSTSVTTKFSMKKWNNGLYAIDVIKKNITIKSSDILKAWSYAYWRTYSDVFDAMVLANVQDQYNEDYKVIKKITRRQGLIAWKVPVKLKDKIRATLMVINPKIIPSLIKLRDKKYKIRRG